MTRLIKFLLALSLLPLSIAWGQNTTITATVVDSDGTVWANAPYSLNFRVNPSQPNQNVYNINGVPLNPALLQYSGYTNGSGVLSQAVYQNTAISPSGSQWILQICPLSSAPACGSANVSTSGSTMDISTSINTAITAPRFPALAGAYGYADSEAQITIPVGATYWNVTLQGQRYWNGSTWVSGGLPTGVSCTGSGTSQICTFSGTVAATTANVSGTLNAGTVAAGVLNGTSANFSGDISSATGAAYLFSYFPSSSAGDANLWKLYLATSTDGATFRSTGPIFSPPSGYLRDPHISSAQINGLWYMTFTSGFYDGTYTGFGVGQSTSFGWATSRDFTHWTYGGEISVPGSVTTWAPEIFIDSDSSVHVFLAASIGRTSSDFYLVEMHPITSDWSGNWSTPVDLTGTSTGISDTLDPEVIKDPAGSTYILTYGSGPAIYIAMSSSITGPYTQTAQILSPSGTSCEGSTIVQNGTNNSPHYRLFFVDGVPNSNLYFSDSIDLSTWSTPGKMGNDIDLGLVPYPQHGKMNYFTSLSTKLLLGTLMQPNQVIGSQTITGYLGSVVKQNSGSNAYGVIPQTSTEGQCAYYVSNPTNTSNTFCVDKMGNISVAQSVIATGASGIVDYPPTGTNAFRVTPTNNLTSYYAYEVTNPTNSSIIASIDDAGYITGTKFTGPGTGLTGTAPSLTSGNTSSLLGATTTGSYSGATTGTAELLFTLPSSTNAAYIVRCNTLSDDADYGAEGIVTTSNTALLAQTGNGSGMIMTISGFGVRCAQYSGGSQVIAWSYVRIM